MYKIVMLVYVLVSGQPMESPTAVELPQSFAGMTTGLDKCQEYLKSPAFAVDRSRLSQRVTAIVTWSEKLKAMKSGEPPPVIDTAITASCETDDRL